VICFSDIDSWGKIPSGILKGHWMEFGDFNECVNINEYIVKYKRYLIGKYCFANFPLKKIAPSLPKLPIQIGICIPKSCSGKQFDRYLKILYKYLLNISFEADEKLINDRTCTLAEKEPLHWVSWLTMYLSFFLLLF